MLYRFFKAALLAGAAAVSVSGGCASAADRLPAPLLDRDFHFNSTPDAVLVSLGRDLFFDPILSGNRNISCGTCHDPARGTGDGVALGIGEGGRGFGPARRTKDGVTGRVPRNAQPLYNIGARSYRAMFHDGRLEPDTRHIFQSGYWSPAREDLPTGLATPLAAQAMFPVLSPIEMAGQKGENPVATAVAEDRKTDAWSILSGRLAATPGYAARFVAAFDDVDVAQDIRFTHAATALAAFQTIAFRSDESLFDKALRARDPSLMGESEARGWAIFSGKAGCVTCHSGPLLTDHAFYAIGMPQIGPGKGHGRDTSYWRRAGFKARLEDEGRYRVTFEQRDLFRFRTPSLRNVAMTGPWGHSGAFDTLEGIVRHHLDALVSLENYTPTKLPPLDDVVEQTGRGSRLIFRPLNPARKSAFDARDSFVQTSRALRGRIAAANTLAPIKLSDAEVRDLLAFLHALTDPTARDRSDLIPASVPSGLPPQPTPPGNRSGAGEPVPGED